MPTVKYNRYLEINPAFESVIDIDADKRNRNLWQEYIVGDDMERLMEFLCQSLGNEVPDARRSFWIHGSYGTGKSYAALFVKHLMEESPETVDAFLSSRSVLSKFRNRFAKCRKNGDYLVIWKTGCTGIRTGDMMLLEAEKAVYDALREKYGEKAYLGSDSLMDAVKAKLADPSINWPYLLENTTLGDDFSSVEELRKLVNNGDLSALQATATVIRQKGYGLVNNLETFKAWIGDVIDGNQLSKSGIFFIWDEFTEYVAHSDDRTVMQQISEFCKQKPFFMFYVVHRSQEMLDSMGKDRYQLITARFHEVEFHVSADAAFDLIAGSINTLNGMEEHWKEAQKPVIQRIRPFLPDISGLEDKISEKIDKLCPIHPMTIRLLSRVAQNFAASQRTMFRFMKDQSDTEHGFVGFINQYGPDDQACWLTPDWLWDYFFTRESDFNDRETRAAEFIHHYEDSRHLVENDDNAHRIFKTALLLLAVMSSTKGFYGGVRTQSGISATVDCLENCLCGVIAKEQIEDLLSTLEDSRVLFRDGNRLQLPFKYVPDEFRTRYEANDKKYTRYQMFAHDGPLSVAFEKKAWGEGGETDAAFRRMKICVCCAETASINTRLDEVRKELDKYPYKLGLLVVTVCNKAQYLSVQGDLRSKCEQLNEPRLTIALADTPFTDEKRQKWLTSVTKQELATERGQDIAGNQYRIDASKIVESWVGSAVGGGKIIAWNQNQVFSNQYGMANLRKTIHTNVLEQLFPYAPESIVGTNTAYKPCNDTASEVGITRERKNAQFNSVLNSLEANGLLNLTKIEDMEAASGSKAAESVAALARTIREKMESGQRVVLSDLWDKLQQEPFGYYDTIACGILLGYVFSCYKDSAYSWTDNALGSHVLDKANLKTMVRSLCKGGMTTDYLSAGSITFQHFREYAKRILNLTDAQVANETECWHNMREAVTKAGAPLWALKYLSDETYRSPDFKDAALQIADNLQDFLSRENDRETVMGNVVQLFSGRGRVREILAKSFQDKNAMNVAFRAFLVESSPELRDIAGKLSVKPEELSDKLHSVMQNAIYTWTEEQVREKLPDIVSDYRYLDALNKVMGKEYHSAEDAKRDLTNLFRFLRLSMAAIENSGASWYPALFILREVSKRGTAHMTPEERAAHVAVLVENGQKAMDCLRDGKPALAEILDARKIEYTEEELDSVYAGFKDMSCDATLSQFDKELQRQIDKIDAARNRILLKERWRMLSGEETVRSWCKTHNAPLLWIVTRDLQKAIDTLIDVQNGARTVNQSVVNAIEVLNHIDPALLTDDKKIAAALLETIGEEYRPILEDERDRATVMTKAKMKLGNDMSAWTSAELSALQRILKEFEREKAKKEKLERAKERVRTMDERELRNHVRTFIERHPEYCDIVLD